MMTSLLLNVNNVLLGEGASSNGFVDVVSPNSVHGRVNDLQKTRITVQLLEHQKTEILAFGFKFEFDFSLLNSDFKTLK